jgi:hypothetical protein
VNLSSGAFEPTARAKLDVNNFYEGLLDDLLIFQSPVYYFFVWLGIAYRYHEH